MLPIWASSSVRAEKAIFNLSSTDAARDYGRFLDRRYREKPVIRILGGDWPGEGLEPIWQAMAEGLAEGDGGRHLMTYHPRGSQQSSTWFHHSNWLDLNMIQSGHHIQNRNFRMIAADDRRSPPKPVIDGEPGYEHLTDGLKRDGPGVAKLGAWAVRRFACAAVFAGAVGHTYGCNEVYQFWEPGLGKERWGSTLPWRQALDLPGAGPMQYLKRLIESRPMRARVPAPSLVVGNSSDPLDRIHATRDSDGSYAFIDSASGRPIRLRLAALTGRKITAYWFDPRNGPSHKIGDFSRTDERTFRPPSSGKNNDWVLVVDDAAKRFGLPGKSNGHVSRLDDRRSGSHLAAERHDRGSSKNGITLLCAEAGD